MEKRDILARETIQNNFYQLWFNIAIPALRQGLFLRVLRLFGGNSSQVPINELFTHKMQLFQSCLIVANRVIFVNKFGRESTAFLLIATISV